MICTGIFLAMSAKSSAYLYLFAIMTGTGVGVSIVCQPTIIANYYGPEAFAVVTGNTVAPIVTIISSLSPLATGWLYDLTGNFEWAFIGACSLCVVGFIAVFLARPQEMPEQTGETALAEE